MFMNPFLPFFTAVSLVLATVASSKAQTLEDLMADPPASETGKRDTAGRIPLFDSMLIHPMPDWDAG